MLKSEQQVTEQKEGIQKNENIEEKYGSMRPKFFCFFLKFNVTLQVYNNKKKNIYIYIYIYIKQQSIL